jgi:hypothetical protein
MQARSASKWVIIRLPTRLRVVLVFLTGLRNKCKVATHY